MLRNCFFSFVWLMAALTFAISISVPKGYGIPTGLIFLASISLIYLKPNLEMLNEDDKRLLYTFLFFSLSFFISVYLDSSQMRELDRPSRFILVIPVLILLLQYKNHKEWLWYGLVIGAVGAFSIAFYDRYFLGIHRASGGIVPIMFGNTAMMMGLMCFVASMFFFSLKQKGMVAISVFAGACGITASFLSGTRGGWIALPLVGCFILWQSRSLLSRKILLSSLGIAMVFILLVVSIPQTGVQKRISKTVSSLTQYYQGTNINTSLGMRFDMWKTAFYFAQEAPVFGVGEYAQRIGKKQLVEQRVIPASMLSFNHAHNEFINALSQRGIVGLAFLLALYLIPMRLFIRKMEKYKDNWRVKSYSMAGALIPMCYMDFGLSQVMFAHNIGVMMYAFPIVYFWAAVRWAEREELNKA